ncbi:hypothetical protein GCM10010428_45190 [Actinosynnema pretiosum subsp. pretiosum]
MGMNTAHDMHESLFLLERAGRDTLAELALKVREDAEARGVTVLPVASLPGEAVELSGELTHEQVLDAAQQDGARLLYVQLERVDADEALSTIRNMGEPGLRERLIKAVTGVEGWCSRLEVGFVCDGVVHVHGVDADWARALRKLEDLPCRRRYLGDQDEDDMPTAPMPQQEVQKLAEVLAADPGFRRAAFAGRAAAARQVPDLAHLASNRDGGWTLTRIVGVASEAVREQTEVVEEELLGRRVELAAPLAADTGYTLIRTADERCRHATEWMLAHSRGSAAVEGLDQGTRRPDRCPFHTTWGSRRPGHADLSPRGTGCGRGRRRAGGQVVCTQFPASGRRPSCVRSPCNAARTASSGTSASGGSSTGVPKCTASTGPPVELPFVRYQVPSAQL